MYVVGAELCTWKFSEFQKSLHERGAVRSLTGKENVILIVSTPHFDSFNLRHPSLFFVFFFVNRILTLTSTLYCHICQDG